MPARDLDWPPELHPATAPVFTHAEIYIPSDPERVWARLIRAADWPNIYSHCAAVQFVGDAGPDLAANVELSWRSRGVRVTTTVTEFAPPYRIAWRGSGLGSYGYHGWVIDPVDNGCRVISEATQGGPLPSLTRVLTRRLLRRGYQQWLEGLATAVLEADALALAIGEQNAKPF